MLAYIELSKANVKINYLDVFFSALKKVPTKFKFRMWLSFLSSALSAGVFSSLSQT